MQPLGPDVFVYTNFIPTTMIKVLDILSGLNIDTKKKTVNAKYGYVTTNFNSKLIKKVNRAFSLYKYISFIA